MKILSLAIFLALSSMLCSQEKMYFQEAEKGPSRHEIGLNFTSFNRNQSFVPELSYNYYINEKQILHFSGTAARNGSFYQSVGINFWNEKRTYVGNKKRWFISRGFTFNAGYSRFDYSPLIPQPAVVRAFATGIGYNLGGGFKINDHFNIHATFKPRIIYVRINSEQINSSFKLISNFSTGLNYRF